MTTLPLSLSTPQLRTLGATSRGRRPRRRLPLPPPPPRPRTVTGTDRPYQGGRYIRSSNLLLHTLHRSSGARWTTGESAMPEGIAPTPPTAATTRCTRRPWSRTPSVSWLPAGGCCNGRRRTWIRWGRGSGVWQVERAHGDDLSHVRCSWTDLRTICTCRLAGRSVLSFRW